MCSESSSQGTKHFLAEVNGTQLKEGVVIFRYSENGNPVAVKMRSESSSQGTKDFPPEELQPEVSKACIQMMQQIIKESAGVEYLQKDFTVRYGPPDNASASLPLTLQWISTSKNITEEEWSEHSDCLSIMPVAGQAPALVPVLRSGHGAPVEQASSSAADTSGQPECKGHELDKLIRISLLELISCMEGLQLPSTLDHMVVFISESIIYCTLVTKANSGSVFSKPT